MNEKGYDGNGCVGAVYGCVFSTPLFALIYLIVWLVAK